MEGRLDQLPFLDETMVISLRIPSRKKASALTCHCIWPQMTLGQKEGSGSPRVLFQTTVETQV